MRVLDELVRSGLAELADLAFQERVWAGEGGSEMSSFTEAVATLFVDSGLDLAYERDEASTVQHWTSRCRSSAASWARSTACGRHVRSLQIR